jgi:AraC-like DNA-binding protein
MQFDTYKIQSTALKKYVQYILFNYSNEHTTNRLITSYANNNICLGILKDNVLNEGVNQEKLITAKPGIHSYISGMYLAPHRFRATGTIDEICIDFTPLGYYQFFRNPLKTYILEENIVAEAWGKEAVFFFEQVFNEGSLQQRGAMIEQFLLKKLLSAEHGFLQQCLYEMHSTKGKTTLHELSKKLKCSEKRIARTFCATLDITPKDYMKILRFRNALHLLKNKALSLTDVAYELEYYDQSHFIKDIKFFTGLTPKKLYYSLHNIKDDVLVSIQ